MKTEIKIEQEIDVESPKKALTRLLEQMLNHLQKKDTHGFFTNPVNDQIAPGKKSKYVPTFHCFNFFFLNIFFTYIDEKSLQNIIFQLRNEIKSSYQQDYKDLHNYYASKSMWSSKFTA